MDFISEIFAPVQLLAWVAGTLYFISYQKQSGNKTIFLWAPADFLFLLHYYFMNAPFFMIIAMGSTVRSVIALKFSRKILGMYLVFYVLGALILLAFMGEGVKDYCAMGGTIAFSFSVWMKDKFIIHRLFAFVHQILWIIAFALLGSYGGLALTFLIFISNLIGTGRYLLNKRHGA